MTGSGWDGVIAIALPFVLGGGLVLRKAWGSDVLGALAWAWLVGTLATGVILFVALACGAPIASLSWIVFGAGCVVWVTRRRRGNVDATQAAAPWTWVESAAFWIALGIGLALAFDRILRVDAVPITGGDEAWNWSNRAQAIFRSGGFGAALAERLQLREKIAQPAYPLLNPLLHLFVYATSGEVTHVVNRVMIQMFVPAVLLLVASALRDVARPWVAIAVMFLVATSGLMAMAPHEAWADPMVAFGMLASLDAWRRFRTTHERAHLWLFASALAFLLWSKPEGLLDSCLIVVAVAVDCAANGPLRRALPRYASLVLLLPGAVLVAHFSFNAWHHADYEVLSGSDGRSLIVRLVEELPNRMPVLLRWGADSLVLQPTDTQLLPLLFAVLMFVFPKASFRERLVPTLAISAGALCIVVVLLGQPFDLDWFLRYSSRRLILHFFPACAVWVAATVSEELVPGRAGGTAG